MDENQNTSDFLGNKTVQSKFFHHVEYTWYKAFSDLCIVVSVLSSCMRTWQTNNPMRVFRTQHPYTRKKWGQGERRGKMYAFEKRVPEENKESRPRRNDWSKNWLVLPLYQHCSWNSFFFPFVRRSVPYLKDLPLQDLTTKHDVCIFHYFRYRF